MFCSSNIDFKKWSALVIPNTNVLFTKPRLSVGDELSIMAVIQKMAVNEMYCVYHVPDLMSVLITFPQIMANMTTMQNMTTYKKIIRFLRFCFLPHNLLSMLASL